MLSIQRARELCDGLNKDLTQFSLALQLNVSPLSIVDKILNKQRYSVNFSHSISEQTEESLLVKKLLSFDMKKLALTFNLSFSEDEKERKISRIILKNYCNIINENDNENICSLKMAIIERDLIEFDKEIIKIITDIKDKNVRTGLLNTLPYFIYNDTSVFSKAYSKICEDKDFFELFNVILHEISIKEKYSAQWEIIKILKQEKTDIEIVEILNKYSSFKAINNLIKNIKKEQGFFQIYCSSKYLIKRVKLAHEIYSSLPYIKQVNLKIKKNIFKIKSGERNNKIYIDVFLDILLNKHYNFNELRENVMKEYLNKSSESKEHKLRNKI